jgi:hypothetical protein
VPRTGAPVRAQRRVPLLQALLLPLLLCGVVSAPAREPGRWAVIVGINDYINFDADDGGDLLGAVNDATAMYEVLTQRHGFATSNVLLLLDASATRAEIEAALTQWLPARVRSGDLVVFYFAGHGGLVLDEDGDEPDGLDQTICPVDVLRHSADNDIVDDELGRWLRALPSDEIVVILDSCYSGSATRAMRGVRARALPRPPPAGAVATRSIDGVTSVALAAGETILGSAAGVLEIAAAARNQPAMDATFVLGDGTSYHGGAFTTHLVRRLWQAPPQASYRELFVNTVAGLKSDRFMQDPQIAGPAQRTLFVPAGQLATSRAAPSGGPSGMGTSGGIVVQQVLGTVVSISAGANRGITPGTVLQLANGALVRVDEVGASAAQGSVISGTARPNDAAEVVHTALREPRLRVDGSRIGAGLRARLSAALEAEPHIQVGDDVVGADLALVAVDNGAIDVLGRDGAVRATTDAGDTAAAAGLLVRRLRHELGLLRIAELEHPGGAFALQLDIAGGRRTFRDGDEIQFAIRSQRSGYLTLIDLSPDGTLTVLYPNPYMALGRIPAGSAVIIPSGGALASFTVELPAGTGAVRALITDEPLFDDGPADFSTDRDGAAFADLIRVALQRQMRSVEGRPGSTGTANDWASALVVYRVVER